MTAYEQKLLDKAAGWCKEACFEGIVGAVEYDFPTDQAEALDPGILLLGIEGYQLCSADGAYVCEKLGEGESYEARLLAGCVQIEAGDGKQNRFLCKGRMVHKDAYFAVVRRVNALRKGEEPPTESEERVFARHCVKCGRPLGGDATGDTCIRCTKKGRYVKQLWDVMKQSRLYLLLSILLFVAVTLVNLIAPQIQRVLVDEYIQPKNEELVGFLLVIASLFGVTLLSRLISMLRSYILSAASADIVRRLRDMIFERVQKLSVASVARRTAGNIMQRVSDDTAVIRDFLTHTFPELIQQGTLLIVVAIILFTYDWLLALLILLPMPFVVCAHNAFRKMMHRIYDRQWRCQEKVSTFLHDIFSGIRVVKAFGMEEKENAGFDEVASEECRIRMRNERFFAIFNPLVNFLMGVGEFVLLYYVGIKVLGGEMTLGEMAQFTSYVSLIYGPLRWLSNLSRQLTRFLNATAKVFEICDEHIEVDDAEGAISMPIEGEIRFEHARFGYDSAKEVLHDVSFSIHPGEMVGIVGRSGVGKSTLINLVMRMYDVTGGRLLIDGQDIRSLSQESLRSQIGAVLQETFLFSGTIEANIAYAKPGVTREEVIRAAKLAGAHSFIMKLPDAYNTKVGERGYTLSGGERQRVSIARALLHDPRILILDEATSALDTETEKQIQDALQTLTKDRTTIAIAHRLSTLRNANRIVVLDQGTVAEIGSHDELMRQKGIYYGLVMAQRQMFRMTKN